MVEAIEGEIMEK